MNRLAGMLIYPVRQHLFSFFQDTVKSGQQVYGIEHSANKFYFKMLNVK
jgi:hypothetical protein